MRLKLVFLALFLLGASAAYAGAGACADCYGDGSPDPSGIITSGSSHCYYIDTGAFGSCLPRDYSNGCTTSTASYCGLTKCPTGATCDEYGGGGYYGGGGGGCGYSASGY